MIEGVILRLIIALAALVIGLIGTWFVLRTFDASSKIDFKKAFDRIEGDAKAMAVYYGLRFIGVAFMVGFVIGKAVGF
ncbi:MAG: hypothetical protein GOVbin1096_51 [Prokaryotic dsDNA virus sp.]|jgi:ABC-type antimicrobial peptide transport system permease subunit|nr:MAG: hypothetical protein GOVbin1096_51 [Prokaryotic dsDNA virus sp.]|tara:strand:- start:69701 stop:69934 length:234 start_codon:yes stop_codon:yes gene_type:complete